MTLVVLRHHDIFILMIFVFFVFFDFVGTIVVVVLDKMTIKHLGRLGSGQLATVTRRHFRMAAITTTCDRGDGACCHCCCR